MKYFMVPLFVLSFFSCTERNKTSDKSVVKNDASSNGDTFFANSTSLEVPYAWKEYFCKEPEFRNFFFCDSLKRNSFEIVFMQDPFKDPLTIELKVNEDGKIIEMSYVLLDFSTDRFDPKVKKNSKKLTIFNSYSGTSLFCSYDLPKIINDPAGLERLNPFFSEVIWTLPYETERCGLLDPETWYVFARKNGKEYKWVRSCFDDSLYYSNLQILLDLCGEKGFKYEKG